MPGPSKPLKEWEENDDGSIKLSVLAGEEPGLFVLGPGAAALRLCLRSEDSPGKKPDLVVQVFLTATDLRLFSRQFYEASMLIDPDHPPRTFRAGPPKKKS
mgnify:CR=1 FL=1